MSAVESCLGSPTFTAHHWPLSIVFAPTRAHHAAFVRDFQGRPSYPSLGGHVETYEDANGLRNPVILLTLSDECDGHRFYRLAGLVAHECLHIVQRVEDTIGGQLGREPAAYLLQALVTWVLDEFGAAGRRWEP